MNEISFSPFASQRNLHPGQLLMLVLLWVLLLPPSGLGAQDQAPADATHQAGQASNDSDSTDASQEDSANAGTAQSQSPDAGRQTPTGGGQTSGIERIPGLATPSPYDNASPMFDKPFSLSQLRTFQPSRGALTVAKPTSDSITDISVDVDVCDHLTGNQAADIQAFKKHLLDLAREKAAFELFLRMYSGQNQVGLFDRLPPEYQNQLSSSVTPKGKPEYYNGKSFGELCVKSSFTLPAQHLDDATPLIATLQNYCYQQSNATESELAEAARNTAVDRIIQNIVPGSQLSEDVRDRLLQNAKISGQSGGQSNDIYCLDMQLEVAPMELRSFGLAPGPQMKGPGKPEPLAQTSGADWSLDLSKYAPGQPVTEFGKNLIVYKDANGKSLGANSRDPALAILPVQSSQDFTLRVLVARKMSYDFLYNQTIEFLRFHFSNKKWDQVAYEMSVDDDNNPIAYFQSRLASSDVFPWEMAQNFNDCYLVKQNGMIRFFFNGRFVMTYPTEGTGLTEVRVPLQWDDRLYNVLVKNLDGG